MRQAKKGTGSQGLVKLLLQLDALRQPDALRQIGGSLFRSPNEEIRLILSFHLVDGLVETVQFSHVADVVAQSDRRVDAGRLALPERPTEVALS